MNCNKCGGKIEDRSLKCNKCGNKQVEPINDNSKSAKRKLNSKVILGIIIAVIIVISTSLFLLNKFNKSKMIQGNTVGNISNGGIATIQDEWIYYQGYNLENKKTSIYKEKTNGSEKTEIESDSYDYPYLNVANNWVYYIKRNTDSQKYSICKMKTDGSEKTEIENDLDSARGLNVVGDWIYYSKLNSDSKKYSICKMKTDGSKKKGIESDIESVQDLNVVGDWIYYYNDKATDSHTIIYKIKTDGSQKTEILKAEIYKIKPNKNEKREIISGTDMFTSLNVVGDWIYGQYYNSESGKYTVIKVKTDGSGKTELTSGSYYIFNVLNIASDWIYSTTYDSQNEKYSIYKMKTDGSEKTEIENDLESLRDFNVVGDWIYYSDNSGQTYKIRIDGSQKSEA